MYASEVDGQSLTFFVSGKLWGRSLVMEDKETGSEWSHILGKAQAGPLKGQHLKILPSVMTNWGVWKERYPQTTATVLEPTARDFRSRMLSRGERFGLGLVTGGKARFWRFDHLQQQPLVNDPWEQPLVVYFDRAAATPLAWKRTLGDRTLDFELRSGQVRDRQTGSTWDLMRGTATAGTYQGQRLEALPAIVSFTTAWERFHPESSYWKPGAN